GKSLCALFISPIDQTFPRSTGSISIEWNHEFIESLAATTETSSVSFRATARSGLSSVAAHLNRNRYRMLSSQDIRFVGIARGVTGNVELTWPDARSTADPDRTFVPNVVDLRRRLDAALSGASAESPEAIRREFRSRYGTGFIQHQELGFLFTIEKDVTVASEESRRSEKQRLAAGFRAARASADSVSGETARSSEELKDASGRFFGPASAGIPADAALKDFVEFINKPGDGTRTLAQLAEAHPAALSSRYYPYSAIPYLVPLVGDLLTPETDGTNTVFGYLGSPSETDSVAFVRTYSGFRDVEFSVVPNLVPLSITQIGQTEILMRMRVDATLLAENKEAETWRNTRWRALRDTFEDAHSERAVGIGEVAVAWEAELWPELEVIDRSQGSGFSTILFANRDLTVTVLRAYERTMVEPDIGLAFRMSGSESAIQSFWAALEAGGVFLRTNAAIEGVNRVRLHPRRLDRAGRPPDGEEVFLADAPPPRDASVALADAFTSVLQRLEAGFEQDGRTLVESGCSNSFELREGSDPGYCVRLVSFYRGSPGGNYDCEPPRDHRAYAVCERYANCRFGLSNTVRVRTRDRPTAVQSLRQVGHGSANTCQCEIRCKNRVTDQQWTPIPANLPTLMPGIAID
ncbi:MAG: hypothetical protein JJT93_12985, partial [Gammaproteobacteria bacterium]|nr:hypothetical protein [Gammaproteobacteria bacterium]